MRRLPVPVFSAGLLILLMSQPLLAWETDVHHGLTRWLAEKAGFTPTEAKFIAQGDQSVDDEWETAPVWLGAQIFFAHSESASYTLGFNHFPTEKMTPNPPRERIVKPKSLVALTRVKHEIEIYKGQTHKAQALRQFGVALHAYQDTWSHQGQPDVPGHVHSLYAWGHPFDRGGWLSHNADLTPKDNNIDFARTMAENTYEQLLDHFTQNIQSSTRKVGPSWFSIEDTVEAFIRSEDKQAKFEWFKRDFSPSEAASFSDYLSLPGPNPGRGEDRYSRITPKTLPDGLRLVARRTPSDNETSALEASSLQNFVDKFLYQWIVEGETRKLEQWASLEEIRKQLNIFNFRPVEGSQVDKKDDSYVINWMDSFLTLFLLEDHSIANDLHHALDPQMEERLFATVKSLKEKRLRFQSVSEAIEWVGSSTYEVISLTEKNDLVGTQATYAVIFRFAHIPRDSVGIVIRGNNNGWSIIRLLDVVMG